MALNIEVTSSAGQKFSNSLAGDVVLYSQSSNQSILLGHDTSKAATLTLKNDRIILNNDIYLAGNSINLNGTDISVDSNSDVVISKDNQLQRLIVDEVQLGQGSNYMVLNKADGNFSVRDQDNNEILSVLPASSTTAGVVMLEDSTSSDSISKAATASAVKAAYDLANTANTTANAALPKAGGTLTGTLNATTVNATAFNASTSLMTNSVVRIDSAGVLSNVSVPAGATTVSVDGSRITGTMSVPTWVLPTGSTTASGIVTLTNAVNVDSGTLAASASAVKSANDLAAAALPKAGTTLDTTAINLNYFETTRRGAAPEAIVLKRTCGNNAVSNGMGASILFMTQRAAGSGAFESGRIAGYIASGAETTTDNHGVYISAYGNNAVEEKVLYILGAGGGRLGINKIPNQALDVNGNFVASGTKNFVITHPDPEKASQGYKLRHSCIESPSADNYYRHSVNVVNGTATLKLPSYFKFLNADVDVFVSPSENFGVAYGTINQEATEVIIRASLDGVYKVLICGTRKDADALKADSTVEFIETN